MTRPRSELEWRDYYETKSAQLDEHGATYGSSVPLARHFYRTRHDHITSMLSKVHGAIACEVGCGGGDYLPVLRRSSAELVIGLDLAKGYVEQSIEREPDARGVQGSGCALPFRDNSVDTLLATEVIEHLIQPLTLIDEASRVLTSGGSFVLSTPNPVSIHDLAYRAKRRVRGYVVNEHPGLLLPWTLRHHLQHRGFSITEHITTNFAYPYPIGELLGKLPGQLRVAEFTERLETTLESRPLVRWLGWTHILLAVRRDRHNDPSDGRCQD